MTGAEQTPQERLAGELHERWPIHNWDEVAEFVLLDSDVIRERDTANLARGWNEGWLSRSISQRPSPNPYEQKANNDRS